MKIPRIVIAGATSGVGKTSITCSIIHALQKRGFSIQPFKVGPDYIDPGYLSSISKNETYNLDAWLMGENQLLHSFTSNSKSCIGERNIVFFISFSSKNFLIVFSWEVELIPAEITFLANLRFCLLRIKI